MAATHDVVFRFRASSPFGRGSNRGSAFRPIAFRHKDSVTSVAFRFDGKRIVSGSADDTMKVWDAATGKPLLTIDPDNEYDINGVAFSPDGKRIVSGDGENNVKVWDSTAGKELLVLEGHEGTITSVAFSHDGKPFIPHPIDS